MPVCCGRVRRPVLAACPSRRVRLSGPRLCGLNLSPSSTAFTHTQTLRPTPSPTHLPTIQYSISLPRILQILEEAPKLAASKQQAAVAQPVAA